MKRTRLGRFGRRAAREADDLAEFKLLVRTAALVTIVPQQAGNMIYVCARCQKGVNHVDIHHLVSRARGGSHDACNGVALCRPCHTAIHDHTAEDWERWIKRKPQAIQAPRWWVDPSKEEK